jgi:uncharacterized membrane protein YfcA
VHLLTGKTHPEIAEIQTQSSGNPVAAKGGTLSLSTLLAFVFGTIGFIAVLNWWLSSDDPSKWLDKTFGLFVVAVVILVIFSIVNSPAGRK